MNLSTTPSTFDQEHAAQPSSAQLSLIEYGLLPSPLLHISGPKLLQADGSTDMPSNHLTLEPRLPCVTCCTRALGSGGGGGEGCSGRTVPQGLVVEGGVYFIGSASPVARATFHSTFFRSPHPSSTVPPRTLPTYAHMSPCFRRSVLNAPQRVGEKKSFFFHWNLIDTGVRCESRLKKKIFCFGFMTLTAGWREQLTSLEK